MKISKKMAQIMTVLTVVLGILSAPEALAEGIS